jgi:hypothetical protein
MYLSKIKLSKSRTFGITINQKTKYQKVSVEVEGKLESNDDVNDSYSKLSTYIDAKLKLEQENLINNLK